MHTIDCQTRIIRKTKYNTDKAIYFRFENKKAIETLNQSFLHKNGKKLPKFVLDILQLNPSKHRELLSIKPNLYSFNQSRNFLLIPNIDKMDHSLLLTNYIIHKESPLGLILVGYFIPAEQIITSIFGKSQNRKMMSENDTSFLKNFKDYHQKDSNGEFLLNIVDLTEKHISYLKDIRSICYKQLQDVYGVDMKKDEIKIFFHYPTAIETSGLHVHVKVNSPDPHPIDKQRMFYIDDIIYSLEQGLDIKDIIMSDHNPNYMPTAFSPEIFSGVPGLETKLINNPHKILSEDIYPTSKKIIISSIPFLESYFSNEEIDTLFQFDPDYRYKFIIQDNINKYLDSKTAEAIFFYYNSFFDSSNKKFGRYERQFSDRFMSLLEKYGKLIPRQNFCIDNTNVELKNYKLEFATDEDYSSGMMTCIGKITYSGESLGEPKTQEVFYDYFSDSSRRLFLYCNEKLIGQTLVYADGKTIFVSQLSVKKEFNSSIINTIMKTFSEKLLQTNPNHIVSHNSKK